MKTWKKGSRSQSDNGSEDEGRFRGGFPRAVWGPLLVLGVAALLALTRPELFRRPDSLSSFPGPAAVGILVASAAGLAIIGWLAWGDFKKKRDEGELEWQVTLESHFLSWQYGLALLSAYALVDYAGYIPHYPLILPVLGINFLYLVVYYARWRRRF